MREGDKTPIPFQHDDACYVDIMGMHKNGVVSIKSCSHAETYRIVISDAA